MQAIIQTVSSLIKYTTLLPLSSILLLQNPLKFSLSGSGFPIPSKGLRQISVLLSLIFNLYTSKYFQSIGNAVPVMVQCHHVCHRKQSIGRIFHGNAAACIFQHINIIVCIAECRNLLLDFNPRYSVINFTPERFPASLYEISTSWLIELVI